MRKSMKLSGITAIALFSIIGCGGGSSSTPSNIKTAIGIYKDSTVEGLNYVCGSETGTTDSDGKFTFEIGKPCTFKVGNIELPIVEASELENALKKNNGIFIEDDNRTIQFLQSLDNANDGKIEITPKVINVLNDKGIDTVPENDDELKDVINSIEEEAKNDDNFTFTGRYVAPEEAVAHVEGTKEDVKAEVAAKGVTFTFPSNFYADVKKDYNGRDTYKFEADKFSFSADKKFTFSELEFKDGAFVLDEDENNEKYFHLENGKWVEESDNMTTVVSNDNKVVTLNEVYQLTFASVKDLEGKSIKAIDGSNIAVTMPKGAEEIKLGFEILKDNYEIDGKAHTHGNTENDYYTSLSEVVEVQCGTRYFRHAKEDSGVRGIAFTCNQEEQTSGTLVGVKDDHSLVTSGVGTWEIKKLPNSDIEALLVNISDKYRKHTDMPMFAMKDGEVWEGNSDTVGKKEPIVVYNQKVFDAISAKLRGGDNGTAPSTTAQTKELLAGKTFYVYFIDHDNADTPTVREIKFNNDVTSFTDSIGNVITAQVNGNVITLTYPDDGTDVMTVTTNNDKYILLYENKEDWFKLFYNEADAQAALEAENGTAPSSLSASELKAYFSGKRFYYADDDGVRTVVFNKNATTLQFGSEKPFSITIEDGKIVDKDGNHFIDEITDKYVKGHDRHGEFIFYVNRADAQADFEENYAVSDLVSGHVNFKGYDAVPSDAWVRIVPSVNKQHGNYEGPRCKIDANGNFGTECYIDGNKEELKEKFNKSGETFQVVVYKNHIKPEGHHWDCSEDVYKYVGGNVAFNGWQNITVTPNDYQDRSHETCDD